MAKIEFDEEDMRDLKRARELVYDVWSAWDYEEFKNDAKYGRLITIFAKIDQIMGIMEKEMKGGAE